MRLISIWSMPSYSLKERLRRTRDWFFWKLPDYMPLRLRYITTIREIAKVTAKPGNTDKAVPDFTMNDILNGLDSPKSMS